MGEMKTEKIDKRYKYVRTMEKNKAITIIQERALASVAQWIECQPENQRVAGLIPSLGHMPGLQARSSVGGGREATAC